ncbi:MAG: hypothetical protein KY432_11860 [Acidobacteria bacterium]|nr:hypothetical protein [Acidobacteriota bacterium]
MERQRGTDRESRIGTGNGTMTMMVAGAILLCLLLVASFGGCGTALTLGGLVAALYLIFANYRKHDEAHGAHTPPPDTRTAPSPLERLRTALVRDLPCPACMRPMGSRVWDYLMPAGMMRRYVVRSYWRQHRIRCRQCGEYLVVPNARGHLVTVASILPAAVLWMFLSPSFPVISLIGALILFLAASWSVGRIVMHETIRSWNLLQSDSSNSPPSATTIPRRDQWKEMRRHVESRSRDYDQPLPAAAEMDAGGVVYHVEGFRESFSRYQLRDMIRRRELSPDHRIETESSGQWVSAGAIPELQHYFRLLEE